MDKSKLVSVKVPREEYDLLKQHAAKVDRKLIQIIAKAIRRYCEAGKEGRE